uniref:Uncharacterized protein n=1 Tax=Romanomermis culicivorax TaxID=13658 RepID=A0A915KXH3_ROMCU
MGVFESVSAGLVSRNLNLPGNSSGITLKVSFLRGTSFFQPYSFSTSDKSKLGVTSSVVIITFPLHEARRTLSRFRGRKRKNFSASRRVNGYNILIIYWLFTPNANEISSNSASASLQQSFIGCQSMMNGNKF